MEKEKLIIKNFGPIKEVDLDLGRFTILIGEQATGKSTVAKVLAVCRYFSYLVEGDPSSHYDVFRRGLTAWGLSEYVKDDTFISYSCIHYALTYDRFTYEEERGNEWDDSTTKFEQSEFTFNLTPRSSEFRNLLDELEKIKPKDEDFEDKNSAEYDFRWALDWIPTSFFQNDVARVMDNPFYLPTERGLQSIYSIGKGGIANLSDSLFSQFSKMDSISRLYKQETYIEPLEIYYQNRNGQGFVRKAKEQAYYSLSTGASGYQAMVPTVLAIRYYNEIKKKNKTLIIEEPELDVFPEAQNKLIQFICEKAMVYNSMILMTTHSPYTLTSLNNLMYAHQVGQKYTDKVDKIIGKKYWVNPDDVSAYMLNTDGSYTDIFDREEGLIKAEKIDNVSSEINNIFNKLLKIEFNQNESDSQ